jgi:hypothetical protein
MFYKCFIKVKGLEVMNDTENVKRLNIDELCKAVGRGVMQVSRYKHEPELDAHFKKLTKRTRRGKLLYHPKLVGHIKAFINAELAV